MNPKQVIRQLLGSLERLRDTALLTENERVEVDAAIKTAKDFLNGCPSTPQFPA